MPTGTSICGSSAATQWSDGARREWGRRSEVGGQTSEVSRMRCLPFILVLSIVAAASPPAADADNLSQSVARVFESRCLSCHSASEKKGGLSLATHKELLAGGESGPVVIPGKPAESLLLDYISGAKPEMPKSGPPLAAEEVAAIRAWIESGAKLPADLVLQDRSLADANWWSLKPLVRPAVPSIRNPQIPNPQSDRRLHRCQAGRARPCPVARRRPPHAHSPTLLRSDRPATNAGGGRCVSRRCERAGL